MDDASIKQHRFKMLDKLRHIKHIEIYIAIIVGLVLIVLYLGMSSNKTKSTLDANTDNTITTYVRELELRLNEALSHISGAGEVTVMITVDDNIDYTYVYNESEKTVTSNGTTTSTKDSEPVIVTKNGVSSPLVMQEKMPDIKGIIIISTGGKDASVRLSLIRAAETLFNIPTNKIEVFAGN